MKHYHSFLLMASLALVACSNDDEPPRKDTLQRTVEFGSTLAFGAGGYTCDNTFVGELRSEGSGQVFVPAHLGTCVVTNPDIANASYEITVTGGTEPFPGLDLDLGAEWSEFLARHHYSPEYASNPVVIVPNDRSRLKYQYTFTEGYLSEIKVDFLLYDIAAPDGEDKAEALERFMQERFAFDATSGAWYNAYSPSAATQKAVMETDETGGTFTVTAP